MHGRFTLLRAATAVASRARVLFGERGTGLEADALLREAARRAGTDAPVGEAIKPALERLTTSLADEAGLDAFGAIATRSDLLGKLRNLHAMDAAEQRDPTIRARPITAPIVVTGLPRSGTTFLHAVLAEHPALLAPRTWNTIEPLATDTIAARERVARQLRFFGRLVPELASVHPLSADRPQECSEILGHVFRGLRWETTFDVPSYRAWLRDDGLDAPYGFHRRFLRHLQGTRDDARWVLKSPDHVFTLPALRRTYPDALLVFVHRDPLHVLASCARLTELLRASFARAVDRTAIGRQVLHDWTAGLDLITDAGDAPDVMHIGHAALVADPVGVAAAVLARASVPLEPVALAAMRAYIARTPQGGYGNNNYDLAAYGLETVDLGPARERYLERFEGAR